MNGLDANVLVSAGVGWLPDICQCCNMGRVLFLQPRRSFESVNKQAFSSATVCVGKEVEQLKPCWVGEIRIVGMSAKELRRVCSVLEGHVGREVPEAALSIVSGCVGPSAGLPYHNGYV
jgi:hypothetical protein